MHKIKGLTLLEVLIVISIISIIISLIAPSFINILRKQQSNAEARALYSLVYFARSEAIKRNKIVTICKSDNGDLCGGDWTNGWIVFVDDDKDGSRDNGEILVLSGKAGEDYLLYWTAFGSNNYIRFTVNGLTVSQNGTFKLCPTDADVRFARAVVVSKTARVRLPKDADGNGIYEDANGNDLSCI